MLGLDSSFSDLEAWTVSGDDVLDGRGCRVATAALRCSSERDIRVQRYAFFANSCAIASPMPRLPPVMRT